MRRCPGFDNPANPSGMGMKVQAVGQGYLDSGGQEDCPLFSLIITEIPFAGNEKQCNLLKFYLVLP